MPCGVVLREALRNESIAAIILYDDSPAQTSIADSQQPSGVLWNFFSWIDGGAFEVSTDAFTTFRVVLFAVASVLDSLAYNLIGDPDETQEAHRSVYDR